MGLRQGTKTKKASQENAVGALEWKLWLKQQETRERETRTDQPHRERAHSSQRASEGPTRLVLDGLLYCGRATGAGRKAQSKAG